MVNEPLTKSGTCFVICPFGNENTSDDEAGIFQEIELLKRNVFRPAEQFLADDGYDVHISDARGLDGEQDTIRSRVIELIDQADVVVFVMMRNKPNGFIEYGWSMGLWKTPIILKPDDYDPPTNINNNLAVEYNLDKISNLDAARDVAANLAQEIKKKLDSAPKKPFEHFKATTLAHGVVDVLGRFKDVTPREWSKSLLAAEKEIIMASSAMLKPLQQEYFDENGQRVELDELLLKKAIQDRVKVTILMQHPDNTTSSHLRKNVAKMGVQTAKASQDQAFHIWSTARRTYDQALRQRGDEPDNGFRVIRLRKRFLPFRATLTDKELYLTLRFYTQLFNSGLCVVAKPGPTDQDADNPSVYRQIRDELEFLITENEGPSDDDYRDFLEVEPA